jgi:oligopeptidase B
MGQPWHDAGRMKAKKNSFLDFIACGEELVRRGLTTASRMIIEGGSAGGLLVGGAVTMRPELFGGVLAHVPFVDVVHTMLDSTLPLTVGEFEEWGNPQEEVFFHAIREYSPYENTRPAAYPPMLITAGLNDPRVSYWEPAKWVARLRECNTGTSEILMKVNMGAGHFGASGRYDRLHEIAFEFAWLLKTWQLL